MNARAGLTCSRPIVLARRDSITMNTNHHRQPRRKRGPQFLTHCFLALVVMIGFGHGCEVCRIGSTITRDFSANQVTRSAQQGSLIHRNGNGSASMSRRLLQ
ncbi:hypothetical protein CH063_05913 [Colletotrichum higginsianum]|uniref:Uncharacterized protein n=1 Tax=Colletotrichum higginsianum (strain IMI 349063) TaxID=759273 RepID=H1V0N6_COLHI|nr:hypothetical protein CH063_05913 [Colletotrichum higginsianum]